MKVIDGKYKENQEIEHLGFNLATMFAETYPHLSPKECSRVFLMAIESSAHLTSNHEFNQDILFELNKTKMLINSLDQAVNN